MDALSRRAWWGVALLAGVAYLVIGRAFALPAHNVRAWRWAAWIASGVVYAAHLWHEHFRLRNAPRVVALHVAVAVAIGAFGLAVAGMVHSLASGSANGPRWLLALVAWPAITAIPAYLATLVAATLLGRRARGAGG